MAENFRRFTPEKVLWILAAFLVLAVVARWRLATSPRPVEWTVPVMAS
jgi:hypothetical protein